MLWVRKRVLRFEAFLVNVIRAKQALRTLGSPVVPFSFFCGLTGSKPNFSTFGLLIR